MLKRTKLCTSLMIAFGSGIAVPAMAQQTMERVEITGSSIRRVDAETALPVTVIKVEDLTKQGVTNAEQAMQRIAANQSNFGVSQSIGATTGAKAEADLRGLGGPTGANGNKTLVLLNGRRIVNHSFDAAAVDLNAIPLNAIDRIEVLRDGASAIYGTDAIGGVINFILKRDYQGFEMSAQAQLPQHSGGGQTSRLNATAGWGSLATNGFNVMGSFDYRNQHVLEAAQRDFLEDRRHPRRRRFRHQRHQLPGRPERLRADAAELQPAGVDPQYRPAPPAATTSRTTSTSFRRTSRPPPWSRAASRSRRITSARSSTCSRRTSRPRASLAAPTSDLMPVSSPFFPAGATPTTGGIPDLNNPAGPNVPGGVVNWRQVPAGKRTSGDNTTTDRLLGELAGSFAGGWDYKTGLGTSNNKSTASVSKGYVNDDLIQTGIFNGLINPFGDQTAAGQAAIDAAQVNAPTLIGKARVDFIDFKVTKELMQMEGGAMGFAFGAEARKEKSSFEATDITGTLGSLGIDPDSDTSGHRKVYAAFLELNMPVLKNLEINACRPLRQVQRLRRHLQPEDRHPLPADAATGAQRLGQHRLPRPDAV